MKLIKHIIALFFISIGAQTLIAQTINDQNQVLYLRRLQLSGQFNANASFNQRSFFNGKDSFPDEIKDFSFGDPVTIKKLDSSYHLRVLPLYHLGVYNTHHPINMNDGEMIPANG